MPGPSRPARRWVAVTWAVLAVLVSVVLGVTTATARGSLGPHQALFEMTTDDTLTLDLGPLGTLQTDSPLPATLGVRAVVQEIPQAVTEVSPSATLEALSRDLDGYVRLFSGAEAAIRDVAGALVRDAVQRAVVSLVLLMVLGFSGRALLGPVRRGELVDGLQRHARPIVASVTVVVVGGTVLTSSLAPAERASGSSTRASAVFDGTPLAGARITGRLGGIVDTYGGLVVDAYRSNEEFYDGARESLEVEWAGWALREAAGRDAPGLGPVAGATHAPADGSTGPPPADPVVFVVVSDLHCNVGMARVLGRLAELAAADAVLDAGDTTMNGTSVEEQCVTSFARAVPAGVRLVTSPGNHDSADTSAAYARVGATVLDGAVVEVDGIRVLGDHDPSQTRVGSGTTPGRETVTQTGERLARAACDDGDVDLLLIHNPAVGSAGLDSGCVPAQVSGHEHRRTAPTPVGLGIRYISSSTAGAVLGRPAIGPLNGTAELTVLRLDPTTRRVLSWQLVRVDTDGAAHVEDPRVWPDVVPDADGTADGVTGPRAGRLVPWRP